MNPTKASNKRSGLAPTSNDDEKLSRRSLRNSRPSTSHDDDADRKPTSIAKQEQVSDIVRESSHRVRDSSRRPKGLSKSMPGRVGLDENGADEPLKKSKSTTKSPSRGTGRSKSSNGLEMGTGMSRNVRGSKRAIASERQLKVDDSSNGEHQATADADRKRSSNKPIEHEVKAVPKLAPPRQATRIPSISLLPEIRAEQDFVPDKQEETRKGASDVNNALSESIHSVRTVNKTRKSRLKHRGSPQDEILSSSFVMSDRVLNVNYSDDEDDCFGVFFQNDDAATKSTKATTKAESSSKEFDSQLKETTIKITTSDKGSKSPREVDNVSNDRRATPEDATKMIVSAARRPKSSSLRSSRHASNRQPTSCSVPSEKALRTSISQRDVAV